MTPDYDLSNLHTDQADLWMYLQVDAILSEILADQPERRASPLTLGDCTQRCSPYYTCETAGDTQQYKTGSGHIGVGLGNKEVN
jgi:hypothetical protein